MHAVGKGELFIGIAPPIIQPITLHGTIHALSTLLQIFADSSIAAELVEAKIFLITIKELESQWLHTPIHINNTTIVGIVNNSIKWQH